MLDLCLADLYLAREGVGSAVLGPPKGAREGAGAAQASLDTMQPLIQLHFTLNTLFIVGLSYRN